MESAPKYNLPTKLAEVVKGSYRHLKEEKELFAAMLAFFQEWPMVASAHSVDFEKDFTLPLALISYGKNGVLKLDRGLRGVASGGKKFIARARDALSSKLGQEKFQSNNTSQQSAKTGPEGRANNNTSAKPTHTFPTPNPGSSSAS